MIFFMHSSCSTKKNNWVNRQYHNTTAKYNGFFNGKESLKYGKKKIIESFKDDFSTVLPVYRTGNLTESKASHSNMDKAIKKGSIVIQRHSMKIKGKEYCKWIDDNYLMLGKAYFYKGEFDEAIKTFSFIKNEYKRNKIKFEASLWLIRSFAEKGDFMTAEIELDELENNRKFPKNLTKDLAIVSADYYLKQANYPLALESLKKAIDQIKRKKKKVRFHYITAQIYQYHSNYKKAKNYYELVLKANPEYEMVFNAKMNLARSLEAGSRDTEKMRKKLLKMTKDDKNKEYLDQIYFTLAEMDINNKDTLAAIDNYLLSTVNSLENNTQKAHSFWALGKIEYNRSLYPSSKVYYDSTLHYMPEAYREYEQLKERQNILEELINNLNTIHFQDSLQFLAALPKEQLTAVIQQIILEEIEKERQEMESERTQQQTMMDNNRYGGRNEQFGNNTSGGKWYFYNPATLSFGMSEFRKKWGKRKEEDDWRRKDKKSTGGFDVDTLTVTQGDGEIKNQNKKDPKYYHDELPKTKEDFEQSNKQIKEAYYQAGVIYKEYLSEEVKSRNMFLQILSRYPFDDKFAPLAYYNVYINFTEANKHNEAEQYKESLYQYFPESIYSKILKDDNYQHNLIAKKQEDENKYEQIYALHNNKQYTEVLLQTDSIKKDKYELQYLFLRSLSFGKLHDSLVFKQSLNEIIKNHPETQVAVEATQILDLLKDPSRMDKANKQAIAKSPYLYNEQIPHIIMIVLPKEGVDASYLKTLISDFNTSKYSNEVFEINAMLIGLEKHLITIKSYPNKKDAMKYYNSLTFGEKIIQELNKTEYKLGVISIENFQEFYKNKDVNGYYNFFKKKYLEE